MSRWIPQPCVREHGWSTNSGTFNRPLRAGMLLIDAMLALMIVGLVATILASAVARQSAASRQLADSRAAVRAAEHLLTSLQTNTALPVPGDDTQLTLFVVKDMPAEAGQIWVRVDAVHAMRRATLTGLVPGQSVGRWNSAQRKDGAP